MLGWSDFPNATGRTPNTSGCRLTAKALVGILVGINVSPRMLSRGSWLVAGWEMSIVRSFEHYDGSCLMRTQVLSGGYEN